MGKLLQATCLVLGLLPLFADTAARVVLPEKYARDPGAGFGLVLLTDKSEPTPALRQLANRYADAVFVCAQGAETNALIAEVCSKYRVFDFPRGRIALDSATLADAKGLQALRNYFHWGYFQEEPPKVTRYGARLYRKVRGASSAPIYSIPAPWQLVEGDEGETGCDSRLAYFTIQALGEKLPAPEVTVSWPGVAVSSLDGAVAVRTQADGFSFKPSAQSGGANYITLVPEGAVELALHHHVEGAQHGPYGGKPLPWAQIRASDNWRAACRAMFKAAGVVTREHTDGASIKLYGFDSNFPRRHVDHPEHFHVMLEWDHWKKNNVGHYILDDQGFIRSNHFLLCGEIAGAGKPGYYEHNPGAFTDYVGPKGAVLFRLHILPDGHGLIFERPGQPVRYRVHSDSPTSSVSLAEQTTPEAPWKDLGAYSVTDDTEAGRYEIHHTLNGVQKVECFRYHRDTGRLLTTPAH